MNVMLLMAALQFEAFVRFTLLCYLLDHSSDLGRPPPKPKDGTSHYHDYMPQHDENGQKKSQYKHPEAAVHSCRA